MSNERQLAGKDLLLYRGNGEATNETFDLIACLTSNDINQSKSSITTETKCGTVKVPGTKSATVPFAFIPNLSPNASKVAIQTLQNDYKHDVVSNWKATTANPIEGDPIFSFRGFISDLSWKSGVSDAFNGTSTIEVDDDGVTLEIVADVVTTFTDVIIFSSSATPAPVKNIEGTADAIDAEQKLEFNGITTTTGLPISMTIRVNNVQEAIFDTYADYIGLPFRYTDKAGGVHSGTFANDIVDF